jgi:hypothetical protein
MRGADWLTGGMFGPESSLLVIATTAVATLWLLRIARRRGAFVAASMTRMKPVAASLR